MERPDRFTEVLLAEEKGWSANEVNELWKNGVNNPVDLDHKIPVHLTYFTTVVHDSGKVATFPDIYGLDGKLEKALFGAISGTALSSAKPTRGEAISSPMKSTSVGLQSAQGGQIVKATWYGNELRGNRTASGEIFNPDGLTVAHKSLPFGTCLVVGNPRTGKTVVVRVNDRGPFTEGMTLDLSQGAARAIGMRSTQNVSMKHC
jgi:rare lipoprotein A